MLWRRVGSVRALLYFVISASALVETGGVVKDQRAEVQTGMAEFDVKAPFLVVSWDAHGVGSDEVTRGGEFFMCSAGRFDRLGHVRTFPLPGAERATREGRRTATGILYELRGAEVLHDLAIAPIRSFHASERRTIARMLQRGLNCPRTASVSRLFDAIAALMGVRQKTRLEGQAAVELESAAKGRPQSASYPFPVGRQAGPQGFVADWAPLVESVLRDVRIGLSPEWIAVCFHDALADLIVRVAKRAGTSTVVLTGECFLNHLLLERSIDRLREAGYEPFHHMPGPAGDLTHTEAEG